jgi:hypothetical protein
MRSPLRALVAAALLATTLTPTAMTATAHAGSWSCTYYKWDAPNQRWVLVATLQSEDWYESQPGHQRYESWDCKYCYVPLGLPPREDEDVPPVRLPDQVEVPGGTTVGTGPALKEANRLADPVLRSGREAAGEVAAEAGVQPFGTPPECPPAPPVWDAPGDNRSDLRIGS